MRRLPLKRQSGQTLAAFVCSVLVGTTVIMVAQAQEREDQFTARPYIGIGAGVTKLEPFTPNESLTVSDDTDAGFHGVIGYDFTSRLSAELYYADLGSAEIAFLGTDVGPVNYQVYGLSGIVYLFNSRSGLRANKTGSGMGTREGLSLFGRVGIGGVTADSDLDYKVNHGTHLALGLGAEYGFSNGFAVRGEYRALDTDQHYASVSLVKRFGKLSPVAAVPVAVAPKAIAPVESAKTDEKPKPTLAGVPSIKFDFNESVITAAAASQLDEVVAAITDSEAGLMLEGHTDWVDTESYNYDLSIRRTESVRRYLESKGIARSRMSVRGFGEKRPIASNATEDGRAINRRVDIRIR